MFKVYVNGIRWLLDGGVPRGNAARLLLKKHGARQSVFNS